MTAKPLQPIDAPLYDPRYEHDACGVGFVADLHGRHADRTVPMALEALAALAHRGARAADDRTGDGAGISIPSRPASARGSSPRPALPLARAAASRSRCASCPPSGRRAAVAGSSRSAPPRRPDGRRMARGAGRRELVADRTVGETPAIRQAIVVGTRPTPLAFARKLAILRRRVERDARSPCPRSAAPGRLQGPLRRGRARALLRRPPRRRPRRALRRLPPAIHDEHVPVVAPCAAVRVPRAQRRDQHGPFEPRGHARPATRARQAADGRSGWPRSARWSPRSGPTRSRSTMRSSCCSCPGCASTAIGSLIPAAEGLGGPARDPALARCEPWDGPAALVFSDGRRVGALLDRNGLRPLALTASARPGRRLLRGRSVELCGRPRDASAAARPGRDGRGRRRARPRGRADCRRARVGAASRPHRLVARAAADAAARPTSGCGSRSASTPRS